MEKMNKETVVGVSSAATVLAAAVIGWRVYKKRNEKKCKTEKKPTLEEVILDPEKKSEILAEIQKCKETLSNSHRFSNAYHEASQKMTNLMEEFFGK